MAFMRLRWNIPVSYTHLDVYKRQSWYSADETLTSEMMNNHMSEYFNEIELKNISFIQAHR